MKFRVLLKQFKHNGRNATDRGISGTRPRYLVHKTRPKAEFFFIRGRRQSNNLREAEGRML